MANKTIDHLDFMVDVTPYDHEGNKYDALCVGVSYTKGYGFYVSWLPVELTQYGYKTGLLPSQDLLVGGVRFIAEQAQKNSAKRLTEMMAALKLAKEGIRLYFDKRLFEQLTNFMKYVAIYGFTPHYQQEVERLKETTEVAPVMRQYNDMKKKHPDSLLLFRCDDFYEVYEGDALACNKILCTQLVKSSAAGDAYDKVSFMSSELDSYLPRLIRAGKRVAICDNINKAAIKREESDACIDSAEREQAQTKFNSNSEDETMKKEETIENKNVQDNAQVNNNVTTEADVAEVNDVMPKVTKKEAPAVTVPLSDNGSMVIGGVPRAKSDVGSKTSALSPQTSNLPKVQLVTYQTKRGETAPRITGFGGETDERWKRRYDAKIALATAYKEALKNAKDGEKVKSESDPFGASYITNHETGNVTYCMTFGVKYMDVAQQLCDAYNSGDATLIAQAEQAVLDRKAGIVSQYQADKEARKAEREARKNASKPQAGAASPEPQKEYSKEDVAAMLRKVLAGGEVPADIEKLIAA